MKDFALQPVICPEMLYPELSLPQKVHRVAEAGFRFVEFWGWRDKPIEELRAACRETGVRVANFSGHRRGSLVAEETHPVFLEELREAAAVARQLDCGTLMLLTNELGDGGRVIDSYDGLPAERKRRNVLRGLEQALAATPEDLLLVLEPLNTLVDHPGYFLSAMEPAVALVREIGSPRLKVLADLYHLGVMGEDLERLIDRHTGDIGYVHVADFPGRHEPGADSEADQGADSEADQGADSEADQGADSEAGQGADSEAGQGADSGVRAGRADWPALLRRLRDNGYRGFVGFEYAPAADSGESLRRIAGLWEEIVL